MSCKFRRHISLTNVWPNADAAFLQSTQALRHATAVPRGISAAHSISVLQDAKFLLSCDPHLVKSELLATPSESVAGIPADREVTATGPPQCFKVIDRLQALPAGIWTSDVESTYEVFPVTLGSFVRIKSPLGVVMESVWQVHECVDGGSELTEDVVIKCSRLLASFVKNSCEAGYKEVHRKMLEKFKESSS
jgi:hypothetical protein